MIEIFVRNFIILNIFLCVVVDQKRLLLKNMIKHLFIFLLEKSCHDKSAFVRMHRDNPTFLHTGIGSQFPARVGFSCWISGYFYRYHYKTLPLLKENY
jgi:hypothetical protein